VTFGVGHQEKSILSEFLCAPTRHTLLTVFLIFWRHAPNMRPIGVYLYLSLAQPIVSVQSDHSGILHRVSLFNLMHTTPTRNTPGQSPNFDKLAFRKYMKNIGRAYQKQAMELVSLSRTFVQAQEQSSDSDAELGK
jgi:hypothetical protein